GSTGAYARALHDALPISALWKRDYIGEIELRIELGHPYESRIKKASGRAQHVVVVNYGGRASDIWWDKIASSLTRLKNVTVIDLDRKSTRLNSSHVKSSH